MHKNPGPPASSAQLCLGPVTLPWCLGGEYSILWLGRVCSYIFKQGSLLAQLRETVLEITVLMHSCQNQAVTSAAGTGAQPAPRWPLGGTSGVGAVPLSLRGGIGDQKLGRCFRSLQGHFPTWHARRITSLQLQPPTPHAALNHSRRGNPR